MNNVVLNINKEIFCDTVVIGGGLAGCSAAIAASRNGCKTVLIESSGVLGGQATLGLVTPLDAVTTVSGKRFGGLVDEICDETINLSKEYCSCGAKGKISDIASPHILKYVLIDLLDKAGVEIRFHSTLISVETENNEIKSCVACDKSGLTKIVAKTFIDASGDADLVALSGAEYALGSAAGDFDALVESGLNKSHFSENKFEGYGHEGMMQPVSIFFLMGGVDVDKAYTLNNKDLKFGDLGITKERFMDWKFAGTCGFEITGDAIPMPQGRVLVTRSNREGVAVINMSRVVNINGSDSEDLNRGELLAQKQIIALVDFLKTFIPGFENAYYLQSGFTLGVRETRRLVGKTILRGIDAINCKEFPDVIARGSYIIDIHDPTGKARAIGGSIKGDCYDIPFGAVASKDISNLLACGRCISSDHIAHSSTRIQGTCVMTGQAVGTASAIAKDTNKNACEIDVSILQKKLREAGLYI